jgi:hypothetical protein
VGATEFLGSLQAVEARHTEIEQGEIGLVLLGELDGVEAVTGGADDFEATGEIEVIADGTESCGGIVGYEDADWIDVRHCCSRVGIVKARSYWGNGKGKGIGEIA